MSSTGLEATLATELGLLQPFRSQPIPTTSLIPLHTFPVQDEFSWRHEQGTIIEMHNEERMLRKLNEQKRPYKSWIIAPIPGTTTAFQRSWLILVEPPEGLGNIFPSSSDRFHIDILTIIEHANAKYSLAHLSAIRVSSPVETIDGIGDARVKRFASFRVDVPRSWRNSEGEHVEIDLMGKLRASDNASQVRLRDDQQHLITIEWDISSATFEAELAALRFFTEEKQSGQRRPSLKSERVFRMIQNFHESWKENHDLSVHFPQLRNPAMPAHKIPAAILTRFQSFNQDQICAFFGLQRIPNGAYFVNGCPGSGKTEWSMVLAAMLQAQNTQRHKVRRHRILFLVDINKTADDAAARYQALCEEAGINLRIVRMHGWPLEMRQSAKLQKAQAEPNKTPADPSVDFTSRFLTVAGLSKHVQSPQDSGGVPTLDEASWRYFEKNKHGKFPELKSLLTKMDGGEVLSSDNLRNLRQHVTRLYRIVLSGTDFIATTPVAAYGTFSRFFQPDLVFIDEASHARELTTLIPLAYFCPKAWIFTGDAKQTQPFVKDMHRNSAQDGIRFNPFASQLRLSTMARLDYVGAVMSQLLINRRAYGNLHRLPSALFYDGKMKSGHADSELYPTCVAYLRNHLQEISGGRRIDENRIIIDVIASQEERLCDSFWNPMQHEWILKHVACLLEDTGFKGLKAGNVGGTVMIATPYSAAYRQYRAAVGKWPEQWQQRVQVLTVDRAQGNESDVVFLDLVRTKSPGFMNDPRRLNVSITRARQAEIIMMRPSMADTRRKRGRVIRRNYLRQLWDDTKANNRIVSI